MNTFIGQLVKYWNEKKSAQVRVPSKATVYAKIKVGIHDKKDLPFLLLYVLLHLFMKRKLIHEKLQFSVRKIVNWDS